MNILADESVDHPIVERLRADGHDVLAVVEMAPGLPDEEVLTLANQRGALLLTADTDFGELVFRQHRLTTGVVLIRCAGLAATTKAAVVSAAIQDHESELADAFTVVSPGMIRIRPRM